MDEMNSNTRFQAEDFFCANMNIMFKLSPDGRHIAYLNIGQNRQSICVSTIDNIEQSEREFCHYVNTNESVFDIFWKTNNFLLVMAKKEGSLNKKLYLINTSNNTLSDLSVSLRSCELASILAFMPNSIMTYDIGARNKVISYLDLKNMQRTLLLRCKPEYNQLFFDQFGHLRLVKIITKKGFKLVKPDIKTEKLKFIALLPFDSVFIPIFTNTIKESNSYALSNINREFITLAKVDISETLDLSWIETGIQKDISGITGVNKEGSIEGVSFFSTSPQYFFFDNNAADLYKCLRERFSLPLCTIVSKSTDGQKLIVSCASDTQPQISYLYDTTIDSVKRIGCAFPNIDHQIMAPTTCLSLSSFDGFNLECYLTMFQSGKIRPLILLPHGGPWMRDNWGFNSNVQYFCSQGYAVLQVNFRGSTGCGKKFFRASIAHWGDDVQTDIETAFTHIITNFPIDINRIYAFGISYGGYSVLMQLIRNPSLFRGAAILNAPSSLEAFFLDIPDELSPTSELLYSLIGDPRTDSGKMTLQQGSPLRYCENISSPLIVFHGKEDAIVDIQHSKALVDRMLALNKPVEFFPIDGEGHEILNSKNAVFIFKKTVNFFNSLIPSS